MLQLHRGWIGPAEGLRIAEERLRIAAAGDTGLEAVLFRPRRKNQLASDHRVRENDSISFQ
jgi:hypothetical protein